MVCNLQGREISPGWQYQSFEEMEDQLAFGRLTSSSCGGLADRRDPDTSDDSPRACGARLDLEIPLFPPAALSSVKLN